MFSKIFPKIHTEGYKFIVIAVFITIIFLIINNFLGLIGILFTVWVYYFFRDPDRIIIGDDSYEYSYYYKLVSFCVNLWKYLTKHILLFANFRLICI